MDLILSAFICGLLKGLCLLSPEIHEVLDRFKNYYLILLIMVSLIMVSLSVAICNG